MDPTSNDKTPKRLLLGGISTKKTPISTPKNFVTRFNLLASNNGTLTPSPLLKNRVVRNPFESQLNEILHMPVISSPSSLFHAPSTPKHNSGSGGSKLEVFEWTIEELSSFNPVNLVPHETQFREEIDPDHEAEVQAAISSFFNEHQIVPSPKITSSSSSRVQKFSNICNSTALSNIASSTASNNDDNNDCHITSIRISDNNKISKSDSSTQTDLSFPPNLPKEIEELLNRFKNSDNTSDENEHEESNSSIGDRSMMDISTLRRKLFIKPPESPHDVSYTDDTFAVHLSPAPKTPQLAPSNRHLQKIDKNVFGGENSLSSDMFGELSPISMPEGSFDCSSPMSSPANDDISMLSDVGRDNKTPASRRRCNLLRKKNLSESFSMLQNEFNEEVYSEKENCDLKIALPAKTEHRNTFARFDSGFRGDEDSNSIQLNISAEELMQI